MQIHFQIFDDRLYFEEMHIIIKENPRLNKEDKYLKVIDAGIWQFMEKGRV